MDNRVNLKDLFKIPTEAIPTAIPHTTLQAIHNYHCEMRDMVGHEMEHNFSAMSAEHRDLSMNLYLQHAAAANTLAHVIDTMRVFCCAP